MLRWAGVVLVCLGAVTLAGCDKPVDEISPAEGWNDLPTAEPGPDDWPWWRGPACDNIARAEQTPPLQWARDKNILWRVSLEGKGHGTPCVWGNRIFLAAGDKANQTISVLCINRDTADTEWASVVYSGALPSLHRDNSHASSMPACDGKRVFFAYQTDSAIRMAALDLDGKSIWDEQVAKYTTRFGHGASPAIYKSVVIMTADSNSSPSLVALHRKTGRIVWRVPRDISQDCYGSPLVARVAGRDQLFIIGPHKTRSYDPACGKLLWECDGPSAYAAATVGFGPNAVYASGGNPEKAMLAIGADGTGDVTDSHLLWKTDRKAAYVPSPLVSDGLVYAVTDRGLMRCYDAASGKVIWERHLHANFYSSPVLVGERIYLFGKKGKGFVMRAGRTFEMLAENSLGDGVFATPVIVGGRIYLRTLGNLYCISGQ